MLKTKGLTWKNDYEILALSSIIVLEQSCPYPTFTSQEWQMILKTNPHAIHEPVIPAPVSATLCEASFAENKGLHKSSSASQKGDQPATELKGLKIAADIVQTHLMDLQFDGMYRSWSLLKTRLVIDELSLPLVESNFAHFVALEQHVSELAKDYISRRLPFTPPFQIQYMRTIPDSPQIREML
ncbi:10468_t:CDS:2, partial [Paraglomus brasilianum]